MTRSPSHREGDSPAPGRLAKAIAAFGRKTPGRVAIVADAGSGKRRTITFAELAESVSVVSNAIDHAQPTGVIARGANIESLVAVAAACGSRSVSVALVPPDVGDLLGELRDWLVCDDTCSIATVTEKQKRSLSIDTPHVVVATSGTSGPPKLVVRSWDAVLAAARLADQWHHLGWLMVYDAKRWAGIQVWSQAILTGGCLVVPASRDPDTVAEAIVDEQISILPSTPTLLRRLLTSADRAMLSRASVERITLGGEAADGELLAQARVVFPQARVTHVYATTELGEVFRVGDGKPGFPSEWLESTLPGGVRLFVRRDGELFVQLARDSAPVATGDVVECVGDRCEFVGRRSDVIIVGGAKVMPHRVEHELRLSAGIVDARVYGRPSPITGELVAAEIVLAQQLPENCSPESLRAEALARCRKVLEPHEVPRVVDIVDEVSITMAGKTPRQRGEDRK